MSNQEIDEVIKYFRGCIIPELHDRDVEMIRRIACGKIDCCKKEKKECLQN